MCTTCMLPCVARWASHDELTTSVGQLVLQGLSGCVKPALIRGSQTKNFHDACMHKQLTTYEDMHH